MSQSVKIAGALFQNVPSISVPDENDVYHGFFDVSDTTAAVSDVASGKYFYTSAGVKTAGTASGGGGGSNIVQGTFTTGNTRNTSESVSWSYSGSGYPISAIIYIDGGPYNNGTGGDTTWYNSTNRYDVGWVSITKAATTTAPTYTSSGVSNYGTVAVIYKNSTTNATSYSRTSSMSANTYNSSSANGASGTGCVRFKGNGTTLVYYIGNLASGSIGLAPNTKYAYIVIYSS